MTELRVLKVMAGLGERWYLGSAERPGGFGRVGDIWDVASDYSAADQSKNEGLS